jgi:hypothetical protein
MPLSRNLPRNSHILWLISLIQDKSPEAQTKTEFTEMTNDILSNDAVEKITLCIGSTLQRFSMMLKHDCTEEEAIEKCQSLEAQWCKDNPTSLEKLKEKKNLVILKWDEFRAWPDYEKTVKMVEDLYLKDHKFKHDVDGRIKQEFNKIDHTAKVEDPTKRTELLKKYLFEESAFQKFVASKGFKFELYKSPLPPAAKRIISNSDFVPPGFLSEIHFTQFSIQSKKHLRIVPPINEREVDTSSTIPTNSHSFTPVFKETKKPHGQESKQSGSPEQKCAHFIESTLSLLSPEQRINAIKDLIQFTTQKIIPLCYEPSTNTLVI